jgi:transketolase
LSELRERHPDRYVELGISETNTVSVAAGMAASGFTAYILSMGPFGVLKTAEQLRADVTSTHLPIRMVARLSGLAMGFFGASHHAVEDIAIARSLTNLTVVAPSDRNSVVALLRQTVDHPGPVYIRVSEGITREIYSRIPDVAHGKFLTARAGDDLTIIGTGLGTEAALGAADLLEAEGVSVRVLDAVYLKPVDEAAIVAAATETGAVLTVEEHNVVGGLGSIVAEVIARHGIATRLHLFGLPDADLAVALPPVLIEHYELTPAGVAARARTLLS